MTSDQVVSLLLLLLAAVVAALWVWLRVVRHRLLADCVRTGDRLGFKLILLVSWTMPTVALFLVVGALVD